MLGRNFVSLVTGRNDSQDLERELNMARRAFQLTVREFPAVLNVALGKCFLSDLQNLMSEDRPLVVLDFSNVGLLDELAFNLLLCCLEEALKRNGDVKLAGIPQDAKAILKLTGVDRLFEIFNTEVEAISSFRRPHQDAEFNVGKPGSGFRASEYTA
jgi:anti-anti-sigma regulatory factor